MQIKAHPGGSVRYITISADQAGQRIDNFLMAEARNVPKSHIYRIIRTGQVRANGGRIKPTYRLKENDSIRIPPMVKAQREHVIVPDSLVTELENNVIYEDDELLVVNKPPGVAVHAGSGLHFGVIDAFRQSRANLATKLELVHRIDRGTSGCLMIGKSRQSTLVLQDVFRQRRIEKHYTALLEQHWPLALHRVDLPLKKNVLQGGERRVLVSADGKQASSRFNCRQHLGCGDHCASEVDVEIDTGRTHQIRVHAAEQGHAVIGDGRYAAPERQQHFRRLGLNRMYLHCVRLIITQGRELRVEAPTDAAWQSAIARLQETA